MALTSVAALLATWPLGRHLATATLGSGEVLLTAWQLNWFQHALLTDPLAWVDANIFFPYANAATLNDLLLTHAVVTLPAAWADSPVLALNVALLGGFVLCGVFAHLLIVEITDAPWAATVGGTLFALTPFRFLHLGHLSIAAAWAIPLFFWALLRHLRQPSWGRAGLAAVSGLAVALSSLYHAAYVAPIIPLVLLFGARRGPGGRGTWWPLFATGLPALALVAGFLVPYATALGSFGVAAAPSDLGRYGADLSSLARKPGFLGGAGGGEGVNPEAHLYPGLALSLLAAVGAVGALMSSRVRPGWRRYVSLILVALAGAAGLGFVVPPGGRSGRRGCWPSCSSSGVGPPWPCSGRFARRSRRERSAPRSPFASGWPALRCRLPSPWARRPAIWPSPLGRRPTGCSPRRRRPSRAPGPRRVSAVSWFSSSLSWPPGSLPRSPRRGGDGPLSESGSWPWWPAWGSCRCPRAPAVGS